jgi:hypothetical protein
VIVEYVAWVNTSRLHASLGDRPPIEHEAAWAAPTASQPNTLSPPEALSTLSDPGEYDPSGVVSEAGW